MNVYIGVTDSKWFNHLDRLRPEEVNFWRPGGARSFHALQPGEPFLFKLHHPDSYIVGGGFYVRHHVLPVSMAWKAFGESNGAASMEALRTMIQRHRHDGQRDPEIGCTILTQPFFLPRELWIPAPAEWKANIVQGKTYRNDPVGADLWARVQELLPGVAASATLDADGAGLRFGKAFLAHARLGQGAFKLLVRDAYDKRCSMTGERTLPVLEACHIQPHAEQGPNLVRNGLLLRSDLHILYDNGYITVTPDHRIEVSKRIHDQFSNGRVYYALHGQRLVNLPGDEADSPSSAFLDWHNRNVYVA